ncbi:hypothetical protein ACQ33O_08965 [Ferruginibacter sp. SUN002]|uniref:hypothetical protein n=1 Tax=Ferruginibacter sp. SUN002 TaxID=2937789 RepID=UPI003D35AE7C
MENREGSYLLKFQQNNKIALVLILVPVLGVLLLLLPLVLLNINLPEWGLFGIIMLAIVLVVIFTIYLVVKKTTVDCNVYLSEEGFGYELQQSSFLYSRKKFFSSWENISNISDNIDTKNDLIFYQVSFTDPKFTATFNYKQDHEADIQAFWSDLMRYKNQFNLVHKNGKQISDVGFYETRTAWLLTQITYLLLLGVFFVKVVYPYAISWWRVISFIAFALLWLVNYHTNRLRKK